MGLLTQVDQAGIPRTRAGVNKFHPKVLGNLRLVLRAAKCHRLTPGAQERKVRRTPHLNCLITCVDPFCAVQR